MAKTKTRVEELDRLTQLRALVWLIEEQVSADEAEVDRFLAWR